MPTDASPTAPPQPTGPSSTLWTVFLGAALLGLVTARATGSAAPARGRAPGAAGRSGGDPRGGERGFAPGATDAGPGAASQGDRGRQASTPSEIPAKGWKDILWRVYEEINKDRVLSVAAGVTFYALLALFPAVAALVSLYGLVADPVTINDHLASLSGFLPGGATEIIGEQVKRITENGGGALGFAFFSGLAISLWSANAGMKAIFDALNIVYEEEEKRSFIGLNLRSLAFTLGAIVFIILAAVGIVVIPVVLNFVGLGKAAEWLLSLLRWPILLAVLLFALAALYRYGPSRDKPQWRWVTWGSFIAGFAWLVGSMLFSWYVANFGSYNETYGSLGAVVGFMTWIWLSTTIILIGGEINAEMEHQTAHDTTEGAHKPLGTRGARMADTVAPAKA
ncbi:MAG TPA: YhjD/YihY/BrkB family envelope integrity protein [Beijerinckiaceae bacterium]|jgi:membrane protein